MLHEVLLGLSGHPSALLNNASTTDFPLITPAESALLESVSRLASVNRALQGHLKDIQRRHSSPICRAVAGSAGSVHLAKFQQAILDVESEILLGDSSSVGAYNIVPLANIVSRFEVWKRKLYWLWDLACFTYDPEATSRTSNGTNTSQCNGIQLLSRLRTDSQTGFSDVREIALELNHTAEIAWFRLLVPWVTDGSRVLQGSGDFLIREGIDEETKHKTYAILDDLMPAFVTHQTSSSILFIGRTIDMLKGRRRTSNVPSIVTHRRNSEKDDTPALTSYLENALAFAKLSSPTTPLSSVRFAVVIDEMRTFLAAEISKTILPTSKFMNVVRLMREFFLANRGDFIDALIQESDRLIKDRHKRMALVNPKEGSLDLAGVMIREGEVRAVLNDTWPAIAPSVSKATLVDHDLEWARERCILTIPARRKDDGLDGAMLDAAAMFDSFLLLTPTTLSLKIDPIFDLFLHKSQKCTYAIVNGYLVAIRRANNHLCNMWRSTSMRRERPAPAKTKNVRSSISPEGLEYQRRRFSRRMVACRKFWSSSSTAASLLAELGGYLSHEAIEASWNAFAAWASPSGGTNVSTALRNSTSDYSPTASRNALDPGQLPHDPEALAQGHKLYMETLCETLMLTNTKYTRALRDLLKGIDHLVATHDRFLGVQRNADLQDEGVYENQAKDYTAEEHSIRDDLDKASRSIDSLMRQLVKALEDASDAMRLQPRKVNNAIGFQPWRDVSAIDHLLVRLDSRVK